MTTQELADFLVAQYRENYSHYDFSKQHSSIIPEDPEHPRFSSRTWNEITNRALETFFPESEYIENFDYNQHEYIQGAKVELNEEFKSNTNLGSNVKWIKGITKIEFRLFYPNIVSQLYENDTLRFNKTNLGEFYSFLVRNFIRHVPYLRINDVENIKKLIKFYINHFYGILNNPHSRIKCNDPSLIAARGREIMTLIQERFQNKIIYLDTDTIFFHKIDDQVDEITRFITDFGIPIEIDNGYEGMFFQKKRYILSKDGNVKLCGIQEFRTREERLERQERRRNQIQSETNMYDVFTKKVISKLENKLEEKDDDSQFEEGFEE